MGDKLIVRSQSQLDTMFWKQTKLCWVFGVSFASVGLVFRSVFLTYFDAHIEASSIISNGAYIAVPGLLFLAFVLIAIGGVIRVLQRIGIQAIFENPRPKWANVVFFAAFAREKCTSFEVKELHPAWLWSRWLMLDENELRRKVLT